MNCDTFASLLNPDYYKSVVMDYQQEQDCDIPYRAPPIGRYSGLLTNRAFKQHHSRRPEDSFACLSMVSEDGAFYDDCDISYDGDDERTIKSTAVETPAGDGQRPEEHVTSKRRTNNSSADKQRRS
uniref:Uncharacterized protein n=1 Tax=Grammatophora oceanica TaxID=210454 RepID=A0A7S1UN62_9STRA|mmetsp:Transcript_13841/g.20262  ORF Transcript_13841/g.20262 Transcript_13841/m.20262 type:complete len:126 (+) Transcript_13841:120-497(+)|eukprot:CAMPEP_0194041466 /NCGR_PEP_ID=MMETSP0009_2-20130614/13367_1 /TAXON_ID=210454 /ORGANISM="Grammatophora oceanica, Strain CCMP 410" /LENGTH=125 /DNA_ID=CAMNT_0038684985 /DNA_START=120 /DNA_END=497 /DNA_ORIENTATION=-